MAGYLCQHCCTDDVDVHTAGCPNDRRPLLDQCQPSGIGYVDRAIEESARQRESKRRLAAMLDAEDAAVNDESQRLVPRDAPRKFDSRKEDPMRVQPRKVCTVPLPTMRNGDTHKVVAWGLTQEQFNSIMPGGGPYVGDDGYRSGGDASAKRHDAEMAEVRKRKMLRDAGAQFVQAKKDNAPHFVTEWEAEEYANTHGSGAWGPKGWVEPKQQTPTLAAVRKEAEQRLAAAGLSWDIPKKTLTRELKTVQGTHLDTVTIRVTTNGVHHHEHTWRSDQGIADNTWSYVVPKLLSETRRMLAAEIKVGEKLEKPKFKIDEALVHIEFADATPAKSAFQVREGDGEWQDFPATITGGKPLEIRTTPIDPSWLQEVEFKVTTPDLTPSASGVHGDEKTERFVADALDGTQFKFPDKPCVDDKVCVFDDAPKYKCYACFDTGVIRWPPDKDHMFTRVAQCDACNKRVPPPRWSPIYVPDTPAMDMPRHGQFHHATDPDREHCPVCTKQDREAGTL